ncbi:MAG TPA: low affinity iron permease family protein [Chloroflexota bacterium]|nr:low affinity iron permease family protein [Chloroflexota bacterium]
MDELPNGPIHDRFRHFAQAVARAVGRSWVFAIACAVVIVWALTGPLYHYSDTWQLVINTGTTIVTFLMVFLIQNTQNRDAKAMHLKLDELLRGVEGARTGMVDLEHWTDEELERLQAQFQRIRKLREVSPTLAEQAAKQIVQEEGGKAAAVSAAAETAAKATAGDTV